MNPLRCRSRVKVSIFRDNIPAKVILIYLAIPLTISIFSFTIHILSLVRRKYKHIFRKKNTLCFFYILLSCRTHLCGRLFFSKLPYFSGLPQHIYLIINILHTVVVDLVTFWPPYALMGVCARTYECLTVYFIKVNHK